ncbi:helix-turn-helix domain-containing protein [Haloarculaceae archaeon H-GB1-1]|nr:helix-turn-helix domain-containing protein [Haloarculaceae archaeon H-GB1-1]
MASVIPQPQDRPSREPTTLEDDSDVQRVLDALNDSDCRAILEAIDEESLSAKEISERCELPLSTSYRKIDVLETAGLISEKTRLSPSGNHASEYERLVEDVVMSVEDGDGLKLTVSLRDGQDRSPFQTPPRTR